MHRDRALGRRLALSVVLAMTVSGSAEAGRDASPLDRCLEDARLTRIARVVSPDGGIVFARVTETADGLIRSAVAIAPDATPLAQVFESAASADASASFRVPASRVCSPVPLSEAELDAEQKVLISTGLNYAAHAEEAGGGDVFLFPKPAAPTSPYARVHPPAGVVLLDYEIELAFVLFDAVDPAAPPSAGVLLERSAFFLSNDISDRAPIVEEAALSGPGTGFPRGKGQPGFFPAGPWMVRGSELFGAMESCGAKGLGLRLWVDDEDTPRQDATTERMLLDPPALVARIGRWIEEEGLRSTMPFARPGGAPRFYPFAVPEDAPRLSPGSIVQTGTPEGVALSAPSPVGLTLRGLVNLRSPFAQFLVEEKERFAQGGTRYLSAGSVVHARIDGLGAQRFEIGEAGSAPLATPCQGAAAQ